MLSDVGALIADTDKLEGLNQLRRRARENNIKFTIETLFKVLLLFDSPLRLDTKCCSIKSKLKVSTNLKTVVMGLEWIFGNYTFLVKYGEGGERNEIH